MSYAQQPGLGRLTPVTETEIDESTSTPIGGGDAGAGDPFAAWRAYLQDMLNEAWAIWNAMVALTGDPSLNQPERDAMQSVQDAVAAGLDPQAGMKQLRQLHADAVARTGATSIVPTPTPRPQASKRPVTPAQRAAAALPVTRARKPRPQTAPALSPAVPSPGVIAVPQEVKPKTSYKTLAMIAGGAFLLLRKKRRSRR